MFVGDIVTEIELLHNTGKLFHHPPDATQQPPFVFAQCRQQMPSNDFEEQSLNDDRTPQFENVCPIDLDCEEGEVDDSLQVERLAQCLSE